MPKANSKEIGDDKSPHPFPLMVRPEDLAGRLGVTRRYIYKLRRHPDPKRRLLKWSHLFGQFCSFAKVYRV